MAAKYFCIDCGEEHEADAASVAWADQFRAEFRDRSRQTYSDYLAAAGVTLVLSQEQVEGMDAMFELGGSVVYDMLAERGALKRAER